jgi:hypothetical protein
MFFRRKKKISDDILEQPIVGQDGNLYVIDGEEYDDQLYETDSDYEEEGCEEEEKEEVRELEYEEYDDDDDDDDDTDSDDDDDDDVSDDENDTEKDDEIDEDSTNEVNDKSIDSETAETRNVQVVDYNAGSCKTNVGVEMHPVHASEINTTSSVEKLSSEEKQLDEVTIEKDNESTPLLQPVTSDDKEEKGEEDTEVNEDEEVSTNEEEEQEPSTTLTEKRSLLALAAEHDRVDIIKTILQLTHPDGAAKQTDSAQLIQLLLNNKIIGNGLFTQDHIEEVFLPPLHIAIASSSTNAASCLLRMGADPSIKPKIPSEWDGPVWNDESKRKDDLTSYWRKLNGLTAWEVGFGPNAKENSEGRDDEDTLQNEKKGSWFWSPSKSSSVNSKKGPLFDIAPSKLEGIKHAFTAEALRAIGSDEVNRLRELLGSGLDSPQKQNGQYGGGDRGVEIGGKDLFGWCIEMNAERCSEMLREKYSLNAAKTTDVAKNETSPKADTNTEEGVQPSIMSEQYQDSTETIVDEEVNEANMYHLEIKLEENRVLAGSLSLVLDNLAEEVSLTQGLLYQQGDDTNSTLISQVRTLKESRGDIEAEISEWEGRLADRIVELRMVLHWWEREGGAQSDFAEIFDSGNGLNQISSPMPTPSKPKTPNDSQTLKSKIMEMTAQVTLSESKVSKLRSSIADLAEENTRNLIEVTKKGLGGAVSLARKLKEEVKEREHILQNLKQREAACRTRVCMIRTELESLSTEAPISRMDETNTDSNNNERDSSEVEENDQEAETVDTINTTDAANVDENEVDETEVIEYYDSEEDCIIEYVDDSEEGSDIEYEYYTDSEDEEDEIPLSEAIRTGQSTALLLRNEEPHTFLSFKIWELLMRIVGLSKQAIKETAESNGLTDLASLPRAMIV